MGGPGRLDQPNYKPSDAVASVCGGGGTHLAKSTTVVGIGSRGQLELGDTFDVLVCCGAGGGMHLAKSTTIVGIGSRGQLELGDASDVSPSDHEARKESARGEKAPDGPAASKYKSLRRRPSSIAFLKAELGNIKTLQGEIRRVIDDLSHDAEGERGLALEVAQDGVHATAAVAQDGVHATAAVAQDGVHATATLLGGRPATRCAPCTRSGGAGARSPPAPLAPPPRPPRCEAQRVFDLLGGDGMLSLFQMAREASRVEVMEKAYNLIACLAQWPALREAFAAGNYHAMALADLRNPMRQNKYRRSPARVLMGLAQHAPIHARLADDRALSAAVSLSMHPEQDLVGYGLRAMIGFMQGTPSFRQKLACDMAHVARLAASRDRAEAPLVAPALRCVRLAAMDTGEVVSRDWIDLQKEQEAAIPGLKELGLAEQSLRKELAALNGERAVARLFSDSDRIYSMIQIVAGVGPAWADEGDEALASGGRWAPSADATYVLATVTALDAGLKLLLRNTTACSMVQAACASELEPLRERCIAATRCIERGVAAAFADPDASADASATEVKPIEPGAPENIRSVDSDELEARRAASMRRRSMTGASGRRGSLTGAGGSAGPGPSAIPPWVAGPGAGLSSVDSKDSLATVTSAHSVATVGQLSRRGSGTVSHVWADALRHAHEGERDSPASERSAGAATSHRRLSLAAAAPQHRSSARFAAASHGEGPDDEAAGGARLARSLSVRRDSAREGPAHSPQRRPSLAPADPAALPPRGASRARPPSPGAHPPPAPPSPRADMAHGSLTAADFHAAQAAAIAATMAALGLPPGAPPPSCPSPYPSPYPPPPVSPQHPPPVPPSAFSPHAAVFDAAAQGRVHQHRHSLPDPSLPAPAEDAPQDPQAFAAPTPAPGRGLPPADFFQPGTTSSKRVRKPSLSEDGSPATASAAAAALAAVGHPHPVPRIHTPGFRSGSISIRPPEDRRASSSSQGSAGAEEEEQRGQRGGAKEAASPPLHTAPAPAPPGAVPSSSTLSPPASGFPTGAGLSQRSEGDTSRPATGRRPSISAAGNEQPSSRPPNSRRPSVSVAEPAKEEPVSILKTSKSFKAKSFRSRSVSIDPAALPKLDDDAAAAAGGPETGRLSSRRASMPAAGGAADGAGVRPPRPAASGSGGEGARARAGGRAAGGPGALPLLARVDAHADARAAAMQPPPPPPQAASSLGLLPSSRRQSFSLPPPLPMMYPLPTAAPMAVPYPAALAAGFVPPLPPMPPPPQFLPHAYAPHA
eukprot:tig00000157_g9713.t1